MSKGDKSFDGFMAEVRASLEKHAVRKGYNDHGADGGNSLYDFTCEIGAEPGHTIGEIIYKGREYCHEPRAVLPVKIAAWAFLLWRKTEELRKRKGLASECSENSLPHPA